MNVVVPVLFYCSLSAFVRREMSQETAKSTLVMYAKQLLWQCLNIVVTTYVGMLVIKLGLDWCILCSVSHIAFNAVEAAIVVRPQNHIVPPHAIHSYRSLGESLDKNR